MKNDRERKREIKRGREGGYKRVKEGKGKKGKR